MKTLILFLSLALVTLVGAQVSRDESESEGMKRILNPTLNSAGGLQNKAFYGGADKGFATQAGDVKTFRWTDLFRLRTYSGSKNFDSKNYWTGEFERGVKSARTEGNYTIPNAATGVPVKTNPVREDRDAGKTQETKDYDKNRPFLVQGKAQKAIDSQQEALKPLTVDDVRKLLNTTR